MSDRSAAGASALSISWLFSPAEDLLAFALPTGVALVIVLLLASGGRLQQPLGQLGWLGAVVLVDVAHVYATLYRVYADRSERQRRWRLYLGLPVAAYLVGVFLHALSELFFWRALAYLAVFHFVRQQYGFIALAGRKERDFTPLDRRLDTLAIYVGTLYPLLYWHLVPPRRFHWFVDGDFLSLGGIGGPRLLALLQAGWLLVGLCWLGRQLQRLLWRRSLSPTRLLVMVSTWATWYLGIVYWNSDIAFTLTNVLPHGIPYFVLLFRYRSGPALRPAPSPRPPGRLLAALLLFYLPLALLAFIEEGLWDRLVWHEHGLLFPLPPLDISDLTLGLLAPLLSLPQSVHYLLDAWIWKVGAKNPELRRQLGL